MNRAPIMVSVNFLSLPYEDTEEIASQEKGPYTKYIYQDLDLGLSSLQDYMK
jgi:hypothetical protein